MTIKELMYKAYKHGEGVGTYRMSNLGERYAPYTFDSWFNQLTEKHGEDLGLELKQTLKIETDGN